MAAATGNEKKTGSLEDQLRSMLLNSVTVTGSQTNHPQGGAQQQHRGRERGRGRQHYRGNQNRQNRPAQPTSDQLIESDFPELPGPNAAKTRGTPRGGRSRGNQKSQTRNSAASPGATSPDTPSVHARNVSSVASNGRRNYSSGAPQQASLNAEKTTSGLQNVKPVSNAPQPRILPRALRDQPAYGITPEGLPITPFQISTNPSHGTTLQRPHGLPPPGLPITPHHSLPHPPRQAPGPRQPHNPHQGPRNPPGLGPPATASNQRPAQLPYTNPYWESYKAQVEFLDFVASQQLPKAEIPPAEIASKEAFRTRLEGICRQALASNYTGNIATISLVGFGSLVSGFAMPGSDMDVAIVPTWKDPAKTVGSFSRIDREIPRLLEMAILHAGLGARLLTKTRVPILKVCENPSEELYEALVVERKKWDELPDEDKYPPTPPLVPVQPVQAPVSPSHPLVAVAEKAVKSKSRGQSKQKPATSTDASKDITAAVKQAMKAPMDPSANRNNKPMDSPETPQNNVMSPSAKSSASQDSVHTTREVKIWTREKSLGPLDFPKSGCGTQTDINFSNPLALHNTHLLHCYSLTDPRVRPLVLFVKSWARRRKINSSYSGTLSSYGYVLMVLHYLINVASPPVCPNLQLSWRAPIKLSDFEREMRETTIEGYTVRFWRNEAEIMSAARAGALTRNTESIGSLLRGFFSYFASSHGGNFSNGPGGRPSSFLWTHEVLSLRTFGGILTKQAKEWTGAKTTVVGGHEVRQRYLFAIEDPFEWDHNVARTVQHNGIVAIRDEFRRAWRILTCVGKGVKAEGGLFDEVVERVPQAVALKAPVKMVGFEDAGTVEDKETEEVEDKEVIVRLPRSSATVAMAPLITVDD